MPSRLLYESICRSETINQLSPEEEVFFYRLLVQCDDFGRFDARPPVVLACCFPLRLGRVKESHIRTWLGKLQTAGLLWVYTVDSGFFLQVAKWDRYQQGRATKSRYPAPPVDEEGRPISVEFNGNQLISDSLVFVSVFVSDSSSRQKAAKSAIALPTPPAELAEFDAVLREWDTYNPSVKFYEQVAEQYGHLPLKLEAVKATEWLRGRRKRRCSTAFMLNWLGNAAERYSLRASPGNGRVVERIGPELRTVEEVLRHD